MDAARALTVWLFFIRSEPYHVGVGGGWKVWSVKNIVAHWYTGRFFPSRKAVHDIEVIEHAYFLL